MSKKWDYCQSKNNLDMPLGQNISNKMISLHAKFHEFISHKNEDMNLSLFSLLEFCTLDEQELRKFDYMKDVEKPSDQFLGLIVMSH
jgi:hypothetical protein